MAGTFKIDFDIMKYKPTGILPRAGEYLKHDFIINEREADKGNIDLCVWKKYVPSLAEINSPQFRQMEIKRILKTGVWIFIKDMPMWIPPSYYFALQYCPAGSSDMEFRLKRLKHCYFKLQARLNAGCAGTLTIKSRGDGETTFSITDAFWECLDGNIETGQIGIQSKTREDGINPCWNYVKTLWQTLPRWIKDELCSDFASGNSIAEKMEWLREADESRSLKARNVLFKYYPSGTPMDGKHDVRICILDEVCKWEESPFYDVFTNYSKFIMPGFGRRGLFNMFSSPADKKCVSNDEVYELWQKSNPEEITENGTTLSRIHRYYSNPLEGIPLAYDKWGDADPEQIHAHIMRERKKFTGDKLFAEIRGFPLNEEEMFGSYDGGNVWTNIEGIKQRHTFLIGRAFKDDKTKEPVKVFGNLERVNGYIDGDVEFRAANINDFDLKTARFCFSYMPQNREQLRSIFQPPQYVENCLGLDPFNKRYEAKNKIRQSNAAMVNWKFRDLFGTGIRNCPTMIYCCRPTHQEVVWEDCLKAAIFNRAMIQYENRSDKFENYAEDRGYSDWLLPTMNAPEKSKSKGDAPSGGKNAFLLEGIGLIDANTNIPLNEDDPYWLEYHWFSELLGDYIPFNPLDTHPSDLTMADMQAKIGSVKIMFMKQRKKSSVTGEFIRLMMN